MLKLLELSNFRGFVDLKLSGLSHVNVITGINGAGKTSILEAAFLISGAANASLAASLYGFRGESEWVVGDDRPFRVLFRDLDPTVEPRIVAATSVLMKASQRHRRELTIKPRYTVEQGKSSTMPTRALQGVTFDFVGPSGRAKGEWGWLGDMSTLMNAKPGLPARMLGGDPVKNEDLVEAYFVSPYVREIKPSIHELLTKLVKERRIKDVVSALQLVHPKLKDVQPLVDGESRVIYADVGGAQLLPLSLLGSGLHNSLSILLPLLLHENATILIDEFEDGIHHSLLRPLLALSVELAVKRRNQIFITTHSLEFLRALLSVMRDRSDKDIAFYRIGRHGLNGQLPRYDLDQASELIEANLDLR